MILAHRVALNGTQLDSIDERIIIKSIEEGAGKETITAVSMGTGAGQRITNRRRDTLDVTVKFSMNIDPENLEDRSETLEKINAWAAGGGWLTINYRENRRLLVICAQAPGAGDIWEWTTVYAITFRAYSVPYWEEDAPVTAISGTAANGSMNIAVAGSAEAPVEIMVKNMSGMTINNLRINVGGKEMKFSGLGLGGSAELIIDHIHTATLFCMRARVGNTSVMEKRTGADDFTVSPGNKAVSWSADRAVRVTASVRGRFV